MIGKQFIIAGMRMEVIADAGDQWQVLNLTTGKSLLFDKKMLHDAIRLAKAEEVTDADGAA